MKDTHFLYAVAILAVVGIGAVFVGYATDTLPQHTSQPSDVKRTTVEKKDCRCCSEKLDNAIKEMEQHIRKNKKTDEMWKKVVENF